jgi:hypothetical protein
MLPAEITAPTNRQLYVKNNAKDPLQLSGAEASNPNLKVTLEETQAGMTYKLVVDVPAGYQPAAGGDKISIKSNNPNVPMVTVPITQMKPTMGAAQPGGTTTAPAVGSVPRGISAGPAQPPITQPGAGARPVPVQPVPGAAGASPGSHLPAAAPQTPPAPPAGGQAAPAGVKPPAAAQPAAGTQTSPGGTGGKTGS